MIYNKEITLKNGDICTLRNGTEHDGEQVLDVFNKTHAETDFMLTYPDENSFTAAKMASFSRTTTKDLFFSPGEYSKPCAN